jgi:hypothetical protein
MRGDVRKLLRDRLRKNLALCDDAQIDLFGRLYGPIMQIPDDKLEAALELCERTNKKRGRAIKE